MSAARCFEVPPVGRLIMSLAAHHIAGRIAEGRYALDGFWVRGRVDGTVRIHVITHVMQDHRELDIEINPPPAGIDVAQVQGAICGCIDEHYDRMVAAAAPPRVAGEA